MAAFGRGPQPARPGPATPGTRPPVTRKPLGGASHNPSPVPNRGSESCQESEMSTIGHLASKTTVSIPHPLDVLNDHKHFFSAIICLARAIRS